MMFPEVSEELKKGSPFLQHELSPSSDNREAMKEVTKLDADRAFGKRKTSLLLTRGTSARKDTV